jgi:hypothetical protein
MRFAAIRSRASWLSAAGGLIALVGATAAFANVFSSGPLVRVPDNPLGASSTACSNLVAQETAAGSLNYPSAEVEPYVAADPTNPSHLVGAVQQDRWNDGGSNGLTTVYSNDGGLTWTLSASQPQVSICEGAAPGSAGYFMRATDPWLSFSADGKIVYLISDSFNANGPAFGGASSIIVSRSTDGGVTWQAPVTARVDASTTVLNDKETVTADPVDPTTAYAIWDRLVSPSQNANPGAYTHSPAFRGPVLFSKTTDGGVSWSNGRVVFDPGQKNQTIGNQIVVPTAGPAKGVLVDGFDLILTKGGLGHNQSATYSVAVIRSTDGGATWSQPVIVANQSVGTVSIAGHAVRSSEELPEFAVGPEGNLYAVWQEASFNTSGSSKIAFSESTDGGLHWTTPIRIDQSPGDTPAFTPQVRVASDGTIGVVYYDLESATPAQPGLTDAFIVHCHAACTNPASWAAGGETKLTATGAFDMTAAPDAGGYFVGDYDGLTTAGTTFLPFFDAATPIATAGATDTFATQAH